MSTPNLQLNLPAYNSANWNTPTNENWTILDQVLAQAFTANFYGYDVVLTPANCQNLRFNCTGNIGGGNFNLVVPNNIQGAWIVTNNTVATGGSISVRTANYTNRPILIPQGGSDFIYSDGKNIYSAVSGSEGSYLPLAGGEITGTLQIDGATTLKGAVTAQNGLTVSSGTTTVQDLAIRGNVNFAGSKVAVAVLAINTTIPTGSEVLSINGVSLHNGDINLQSGNLNITVGNLSVTGTGSRNTLAGTTTIPAGATLNQDGAANVNLNGVTTVGGNAILHFKPLVNGAGMIENNLQNQIGFYADNNQSVGAYLDVTNGKWHATGGVSTNVNGKDVDLGEMVMSLHAEISALKSEISTLKLRQTL